MITVIEALSFIAKNSPKSSHEAVPLRQALGRSLANDLTARLTQPPLDSSAMDGYAVRLADVSTAGQRLNIIGEAPAGSPFSGAVSQGEAVRIFTGGAVPAGADTVIIQENVHSDGTSITILEPQSTSRHIRRKGLDFHEGDKIIKCGALIGPSEIAIAAACGHSKLSVKQKLSIAILSGGNELIAPRDTPQAGQIINSNPYALAALVESWGHEAIILPTAKDTVDSITDRINEAKNADVILPVGGASVGDHDHMRAAFSRAGIKMIFEKVAVRPGKPTWFGILKGKPILGLPGNPASAMVCAQLFAKPLLTGNAGKIMLCKLAKDVKANGPRESYQRAIVKAGDSELTVKPLPIQDSGLMTPFLTANGLLKLPVNNKALKSGDQVEVLLIKALI